MVVRDTVFPIVRIISVWSDHFIYVVGKREVTLSLQTRLSMRDVISCLSFNSLPTNTQITLHRAQLYLTHALNLESNIETNPQSFDDGFLAADVYSYALNSSTPR